MTGVDTDGDGLHDTLFGNINFNAADPSLPNAARRSLSPPRSKRWA